MHIELGPGFLESIYHRALEVKFSEDRIGFESEKPMPIYYHGKLVGIHNLDFFIEGELVLEFKTAQANTQEILCKGYISYLKAVDKEIGLLVNFADFKLDPRRVERKRN